jgi:hypothetical protein
MKTFPQPMILVGSLALLAGCASDALNVQGSAVLTSTVAGQTPTRMGFDFTARVTALEAGSGFTGSCARIANRWEVQIARESPGAAEFKRFTLSIPVPSGLTRESPTATFVVGDSTFTASGTCVDTTTTVSDGLHVVTRCTGVRAPGDSRVIEADLNLVLTHCALE